MHLFYIFRFLCAMSVLNISLEKNNVYLVFNVLKSIDLLADFQRQPNELQSDCT
jgi:hypothetical protein